MKVLFDTNMVSYYVNQNPKVTARVESHLAAGNQIAINLMTYYETVNGLMRKDAQAKLARFRKLIDEEKVILLTVETMEKATELQIGLAKKALLCCKTTR